jgi:hypothetical protein
LQERLGSLTAEERDRLLFLLDQKAASPTARSCAHGRVVRPLMALTRASLSSTVRGI